MDFFWILAAIVAISSIVSAVAKNKKRAEAQGEGQAGQRPMSDIQRAAMLARETASQRLDTPQRPMQAQQPNPMYAQQYGIPMQSRNAAPMEARNAAPMQARNMAPMEARNAAPMQARTAAPMEARNTAPLQARPAYATPPAATGLPANFYGGSMNVASSEGWSNNTDDDKPMELLRASEVESVSDTNLETGASKTLPSAAGKLQAQQSLRLFDGKSEYLKAIIYSEVLARRTPGRRPGRA